ncbi:MAG: hypothetical protein HQL21_07530 [Candidatus Omnitrophica bacterium]|nr:hypothetical protein [Candidatus Omnitrophota bacterium]
MSVKKIILYLVGFVLVIVGIAFAIKDWFFIEMVFRGIIGPLLAVIGLVVLTVARD